MFLWVYTYPLSVYPPLVLPAILAYLIVAVKVIGDVTSTEEVSRLPMEGAEHFEVGATLKAFRRGVAPTRQQRQGCYAPQYLCVMQGLVGNVASSKVQLVRSSGSSRFLRRCRWSTRCVKGKPRVCNECTGSAGPMK